MKHFGKKTPEFTEGRNYCWAAAERVHHEQQREDAKMWRHGRFHVRAVGKGRKRYYERAKGDIASRQSDWGKRSELGLDLSWFFLPPKHSSFGVGAEFKWGTNASETTPDLSLYFGRLGSIWIHFIHVIPYRWLERTYKDERTGEVKTDYDSRVFGLRFLWNDSVQTNPMIRWDFWSKDGYSSRSDPWWMEGHFSFKDFIFGRDNYMNVESAPTDCYVPMPEGVYPATAIMSQSTWEYRRPIGRLRDRIWGKRRRVGWTVAVDGGIPVPGKGENSWDCGDDAICSVGGATLADAVANYVRNVMRTRERHGGKHMSVPGYVAPRD